MIIKLFECFVNYLIKSPHNNACYNCHLSVIPEYFCIVHAISVGYNVFQSKDMDITFIFTGQKDKRVMV